MKLAFSTRTYNFLPLPEVLHIIANSGFSYVEILGEKPHLFPLEFKASNASELSRLLKDLNLKIVSVDASSHLISLEGETVRFCSWLSEDWKERELRIRYTLDCARIAASLGVTQITISGGSPIPETMDFMEAWRLFTANMVRVSSVMERLGVTAVIRPSGGILLERSEQLFSFLQELDFHPYVGLDLDVAHFFCIGEDPCEVFHRLRPYIKNIHISDGVCGEKCKHLPFGEGGIDIARFVKCLKEAGYEGVLTVCFDASGKLPEETAMFSANYLKELIDRKA